MRRSLPDRRPATVATERRVGLGLCRTALAALAWTALSSCGRTPPSGLGPGSDGSLAPCPETPNCVHSVSRPEDIPPFELADGVDDPWPEVRAAVRSLPRTTVVRDTAGYLHAEARSLVFRFVDDLEVVRDGERLIVRSASRVGRSDLGVNVRRVQRLRDALVERGVVDPAESGSAGS